MFPCLPSPLPSAANSVVDPSEYYDNNHNKVTHHREEDNCIMPFFANAFRKRLEIPTQIAPFPAAAHEEPKATARLGSVEAIDLEITVIRGQDLAPKDRAFFGLGRLKSSDPYVKVMLVQHLPTQQPAPSPTRRIRESISRHFSSRSQFSTKSNHNHNHRTPSSHPTPRSGQTATTVTKLKVGRTETIYKTLHPLWNETMHASIRGREALAAHTAEHPAVLEFHIFDEDQLSRSDTMGTVTVQVPFAKRDVDITEWYDVPPESAPSAKGRLQIRIKTTLKRSHILVRGSTFELSNNGKSEIRQLQSRNQVIRLGVRWDALLDSRRLPVPILPGGTDSFVAGFEAQTGQRDVDMDVSCVAISREGHVIMPDTVYYGNLQNSNGSVKHSGDERTGRLDGDDESITLQLAKIPKHVLAMYIILTVATPHMTLKDVESTRVRVLDVTPLHGNPAFPQEHVLCTFTPSDHRRSGDATAMFLLRIARAAPSPPAPGEAVSKRWILVPMEDTHPSARDFGSLIPYIKSYTRDLCPKIRINPTERVAILRKGGTIRIEDYCAEGRLPTKVTFGLAWDVTDGEAIDLDASAICLDEHLNLIDMVWWKHLHSKDYNIIHHGDEREGDESGDDELIDLYLHNMTTMGEHCKVHYIGFVINSYSGQNLKDVDRASCHLFDPDTNIEIATYALTNAKALDGVTALLVGCLYRAKHPPAEDLDDLSPLKKSLNDKAKEGEWCLSIISEASDGRTVKSNVEGFQAFLRHNPLQPAPSIASLGLGDAGKVINATMPPPVPLADEAEIRVPPSQPSPTSDTSTAKATVSTNASVPTVPSHRRKPPRTPQPRR